MENIHNEYKYEPLDRARSEIRLLELLPASDHHRKVKGKLFHHSLSAPSVYDALSYTWGDPSVTKAIELDDDPNFHIPAKLESALHNIRYSDKPLIIWIDAICIHQQNTKERNHQVKLMREIYEKALMVHAWIDVHVNISEPVFTELERLAAAPFPQDLGSDPQFWKPAVELFDQRYWGRVWIQQEITFAKRHLLHCRRDTISLVGLLVLGATLYGRFFSPAVFELEWKAIYEAAVTFKGRWLIESWGERVIKSRGIDSRVGHMHSGQLLCILEKGRDLDCQNPLDRVYGIMYLAQDYEDDGIEINYELSVAEVYCSSVRYFVNKYERFKNLGCLAFLCAVTPESLQSIHRLPSWCPDWSAGKQNSFAWDMWHSLEIFAGGKVRGKKPCFSADGTTLHASGFYLDSISRICMDSLHDEISFDTPICDILSTWIRLAAGTDGVRFPNKDEFAHWRLPLLRTLTVDDDFEGLEEAWDEFTELAIDPPTAHMSVKEVSKLLTRNGATLMTQLLSKDGEGMLFRSYKGNVGMVPKDTLFDDEIWILFDCPLPVVLRPVDDHFTMVGVAYVDGHMRGESCLSMPAVVKKGEKYGELQIATVILK